MQASSPLSRRHLVAAAIATAGIVKPLWVKPLWAKPLWHKPLRAASLAPRAVSLYNIHTGEWLRTVYWADGHYLPEAVRDINWILRDHWSGAVRPMNAGVLDLLGMLHRRLDMHHHFLVVCGYRSPTTNAWLARHDPGVAKRSYHIKGMAIDLRCENRDLAQVRSAALSLRAGGVGYYPRSDFVHVDVGPVRHWQWG